MQQLQRRHDEAQEQLARSGRAQAEAEGTCKQLESRSLGLQAQLHTLRSEAVELHEKEDELTLQLLNATNAQAAAEKAAAAAAARAAAVACYGTKAPLFCW